MNKIILFFSLSVILLYCKQQSKEFTDISVSKRFFSDSSFWNQPIGENPEIDPALDLGTFDLMPGELAVAKALQVYGMVLFDWAGGNVIYAENLNKDKYGRSWDGILRD